jgi:hypothetical protein
MLALLSRYLSPFGKRRSSSAASKTSHKMTEDVKMVSIFNEEDLQQEFEAFAVTIDLTDKPVVDKRKCNKCFYHHHPFAVFAKLNLLSICCS